tara:strand:- start:739 stop:1131 length:393 start_codon:yes stop_codon:yes gene_type:complete
MVNRDTLNIIVKRKLEMVCDLYFSIQEKYSEDFEKLELFDSDWDRMVQFNKANPSDIDGHDMNTLNRIWKLYNTYKETGTVYDEWEEIDKELSNDRKINAIKIYRQHFNCGLREAKDAVDARQMKLKGLV